MRAKFILTVFIGISIAGCKTGSVNTEMTPSIDEWCYDGVVYLSAAGQNNTSVKFNPDNTVATKTFNGISC